MSNLILPFSIHRGSAPQSYKGIFAYYFILSFAFVSFCSRQAKISSAVVLLCAIISGNGAGKEASE
jgi:hypothetical protein